jgi:hypothetical protein
MRSNLIYELLIIGVITVVFNLGIYTLLTGQIPTPKLHHFYKMILGSFLLGSSMHFVLEITNLNEKWCRSEFTL